MSAPSDGPWSFPSWEPLAHWQAGSERLGGAPLKDARYNDLASLLILSDSI